MRFIFTRQTHSHSPPLPLLQSLSLLPISKVSNFLQIRLSISQNSTRFSLLMSIPLEHYTGLSEMEKTSKLCKISSESDKSSLLNLKATELRLGLPGLCQDLEENCCKNSPLMKNNSNVSGSKRGFSDVNFDGSAKWGFNGGSESDLGSKSLVLLGINGGLESKQTQEIITTHVVQEKKKDDVNSENNRAPSAKAQVVGWPPIRSFRKNTMATNSSKNGDVAERNSGCEGCLYVKVSMDGAPYLRKVDLKTCKNYTELSKALEKMFNCFTLGQCTSSGLRDKEGLTESNLKDLLHRAECVLTYEDKDGDWMLVGDVPWEMFVDSCRRLRIMKGSEAIGLGPRSTEKCKNKTQQI